MGSPVGLDYVAVEVVARTLKIRMNEEILTKIQALEEKVLLSQSKGK